MRYKLDMDGYWSGPLLSSVDEYFEGGAYDKDWEWRYCEGDTYPEPAEPDESPEGDE
jgi:hypothetical protein